MSRETEMLDEIEKYGRQFVGRKEFIKMLNGEKIPASARCKAKCYDCMGFYQDGSFSCEIPSCPIFPIMPYRKKIRPHDED